MNDKDFVAYIQSLPPNCIEKESNENVRFHLPDKGQKCPHCGKSNFYTNSYYTIKLGQIGDKSYFYRRRQLFCKDCHRTFVEDSPFLAPYQRTIKNKLRQMRGRKRLSQEDVYGKVGIPIHIYKTYEAAKNPAIPSLPEAMAIAKILNVSVDELWDF